MLVMIKKCLGILKPDGLSCYNAMDWSSKYKFVDGIKNTHNDNGWILSNQFGIDSPYINYKGKLDRKDLTYVFNKK